MINQEEFLKQLREAFAVESREHIQAITSGLITLEQVAGEPDQELIENIYRAAHSLKGAARAVDLKDIEYICHSMESVFLSFKQKEISLSSRLLDALHEALHLVELQLSGASVPAPEISAICEKLEHLTKLEKALPEADRLLKNPISSIFSAEPLQKSTESKQPQAEPQQRHEQAAPETQASAYPLPEGTPKSSTDLQPSPAQEKPAVAASSSTEKEQVKSAAAAKAAIPQTIRVSTERLDNLLREAENLVAVKQLFAQAQLMLKSAFTDMTETHSSEEARQTALRTIRALSKRIGSESVHISNMIDTLVDEAQSTLMLPCSVLFDSFPMAARDIAKSLGKEVALDISGQSIELEKRILEKLKDPLMHILRNSIDHGIERPEERARTGKPARGQLAIRVSHLDSRHIEIAITDDGKGIDPDAIRRTAVQKGLLSHSEAEQMPSQRLFDLLFESGFSTSTIITDLSGRGLGLAIVKKAILELEGSIRIESEPGKGTTFRLIVPYTKASFKGNFIRASDRTFVIPSSALEKSMRIPKTAITAAGGANTIDYQGETIGIVHMADILGIPRPMEAKAPSHVLTVICRAQDKVCAFIVDEIMGEQDVLIKPLGTLLQKVRGIYGATIGANDEVIPILNMKEILEMAFSTSSGARGNALPEKASQAETKDKAKSAKRILVVEDSITSRTLITSILSAAGFQVQAATDGIEGYTLLKSEPFDLVVSDIEMPRLDGFGLTERVRKDSALKDIPVILVTALESKEHKEKGIAVGANAYITKSNFAQSNLLDTVRRFV